MDYQNAQNKLDEATAKAIEQYQKGDLAGFQLAKFAVLMAQTDFDLLKKGAVYE